MKDYAMVHGRFQPFHIEHLSYVLRAMAFGRRCIVGITNPDRSELVEDADDSHRHTEEANPFSFFERLEMIHNALKEAGLAMHKVMIVPFELFRPQRWGNYLPPPEEVVQCVRVFSRWEQKKVKLFESHGFEVFVLDEGHKKNMTGSRVRQLIRDRGNWRELVPSGADSVVEGILARAARSSGNA